MDEVPEVEPKEASIRTIETGEWFNPFENFEGTPLVHDREDYKSRHIEFNVESVGAFKIDSNWLTEDFGDDKRKAIIVLPITEQEISKDQFLQYQEKFELRLFDLMLYSHSDNVVESDSRYKAEMRLPSGRTIFSRIEPDNDRLYAFAESEWHDIEGDYGVYLLIPDTRNVFERLEMRIVPDTQE